MKPFNLTLFLLTGFLAGCPQEKDSDELIQALSQRESAIVKISAYTALGNLPALETELNAALDNGMSVNEIKEILIQLYAYCGFPRSLQGINTFMSVIETRRTNGTVDTEGEAPATVSAEGKYQAGKATLQQLTGRVETAPSGANAFAPGIDVFLKEHLFADIFGRGILSYRDRELATCSALAVLDHIEPMQNSHRSMALNVGVPETTLNAALRLAGECRKATEAAETSAFPLGAPGSSDWFTGTVHVQSLVNPDEMENLYSVGQVTFEPKARTFWHTHPIGQVLLVTSGEGFYQERGKAARRLKAGDVVCIPKDVEHWHGASDHSRFVHIAISNIAGGSAVTWLNPVTDGEYADKD